MRYNKLWRVVILAVFVAAVAAAVPFVLRIFMPDGFLGFCLGAGVCVLSAGLSIFFIGCTVNERREIVTTILKKGKV